MPVWTEDEAGPFQTIPFAGSSWQPEGEAERYPHEYIKNGTAKLLTLFEPETGLVHVKGVMSCTNVVLHPWLEGQLEQVLARLPVGTAAKLEREENRALWESWQAGLMVVPSLGPAEAELPALRMLLVLDNLAGHHTPAFIIWLFHHGIMPLFTPLGGSWLNMAESIQRILKRRALEGQHPSDPEQIIDWLEETAEGWNAQPTPFVWAGKRAARRERAWQKRHRLGGSGAVTLKPLPEQKRGKRLACVA